MGHDVSYLSAHRRPRYRPRSTHLHLESDLPAYLLYPRNLYNGTGELSLDGIRATFISQLGSPARYRRSTEIARIVRMKCSELPDPSLSVRSAKLAQRTLPRPLSTLRVRRFQTLLRAPARANQGPSSISTAAPRARILRTGAHPPWWLSIPFARRRGHADLRFILDKTQDVHVLLQYDGKADLNLTDIVLYRETYDHR